MGLAQETTPVAVAEDVTAEVSDAADTQTSLETSIVGATYGGPVERYGHQVLGNTPEYSQLDLQYNNGTTERITLPANRVFEDITPRVVDLDQDGFTEVIVIESDLRKGARLAIYNGKGLVAATPFIGQRNRWLAPIGVADFDGDGQLDIAYIETPHLTGTVRIVTQDGQGLKHIAAARGLTNHRIGDTSIFGGVRDCGRGPEMILVKFPWDENNKAPMVALAVSQPDLKFSARPFSEPVSETAMQGALNCTLSPNYPN